MSKPNSSGRCTAGEAKVLSATVSKPRARPIVGDSGEVGDAQQRIAGRLDPDHPGRRRDRRLDRRSVAGVDMRDREPGGAFAHAMKEPPASAIEVVGGDDMRAVVEKFEHGRLGGEARGESEAGRPAFEFGEGVFERGAGRIAGARILPARVHPGRRLQEGRGREDRRDDGAGRRIGLLPSMDRARRKTRGSFAFAICQPSSVHLPPQMIEEIDAGDQAEEPLAVDHHRDVTLVEHRKQIAERRSRRERSRSRPTSRNGLRRGIAAGFEKTASSRSDSSMIPTTRSSSSTGSCETS